MVKKKKEPIGTDGSKDSSSTQDPPTDTVEPQVGEPVPEPEHKKAKGIKKKPRKGYKKLLVLCAFVVLIILVVAILSPEVQYRELYVPNDYFVEISENYNSSTIMKDPIVGFIRNITHNHFQGVPLYHPLELRVSANWEVVIDLYHQGKIKGTGTGTGTIMSYAVENATRDALSEGIEYQDLNRSYFKVSFREPIRYSFIEHKGDAKELVGDVVVVREMDKEFIREKIEESKYYLFRVIDKDVLGAHKYYFAVNDTFENRVHTIYTASLTFSLMRIYDFNGDEEVWMHINNLTQFLDFQQNKDKDSKAYGGFRYSYFKDTKEKEDKYVVGTTSKTIFTLLDLHTRTGESKYLESAKIAADWLLTMQKDDGRMKSYTRYDDGKWYSSTQFSYLFNGQVLSALSRMYTATGNQKYYDAAERIATVFAEDIEEQGWYLGDDYRPKNPISSSWAILSLFDWYKVSGNGSIWDIVWYNSGKLLQKQILDKSNVLSYGRFDGSLTTSGNGWLNEIFMELYRYCVENDIPDREKYLDACILVTRFTLQNTFSEENSYMLKNPGMAIGGAYWTTSEMYVRTDSVAHAVNAYAGIYPFLHNDTLVSVPAPSTFEEDLDEMRDDSDFNIKNDSARYELTLGPFMDGDGEPLLGAQISLDMMDELKIGNLDAQGLVAFKFSHLYMNGTLSVSFLLEYDGAQQRFNETLRLPTY